MESVRGCVSESALEAMHQGMRLCFVTWVVSPIGAAPLVVVCVCRTREEAIAPTEYFVADDKCWIVTDESGSFVAGDESAFRAQRERLCWETTGIFAPDQ